METPMRTIAHEELKALDPVVYAKRVNASLAAEGTGFRLPEDPGYYEEAGYKTAYDYERGVALSVLSDLFKDANGFRPRHLRTEDMTLADVEAEISRISRDLEEKEREEEEKEREDRRRVEEAARKIIEATTPAPLTYNPFAALAKKI
jgi:hypothetical protein